MINNRKTLMVLLVANCSILIPVSCFSISVLNLPSKLATLSKSSASSAIWGDVSDLHEVETSDESSPDDISSSKGGGTQDNSQLVFSVKLTVESKPLPIMEEKDVVEFLKAPEHRTLLLTTGGKRNCEDVPMTPDLLHQWKQNLEKAGASVLPEESDALFAVQTGASSFPGLKLVSSVIMGAKFVFEDCSPFYEFTLVKETRSVSGLAPVVWIFNKITGASDGKDNSSSSNLTRMRYKLVENDTKVVFECDSSLSISIKFPSVLLKILPTTQEQAEETGSKAVGKVVRNDIEAGMKAIEEAFEDWTKVYQP